MAIEVEFAEGIPRCSAAGCGSYKFDTTFQLIKGGWLLEAVWCHKCNSEIKITEAFEKFIREQKWKVVKDAHVN